MVSMQCNGCTKMLAETVRPRLLNCLMPLTLLYELKLVTWRQDPSITSLALEWISIMSNSVCSTLLQARFRIRKHVIQYIVSTSRRLYCPTPVAHCVVYLAWSSCAYLFGPCKQIRKSLVLVCTLGSLFAPDLVNLRLSSCKSLYHCHQNPNKTRH